MTDDACTRLSFEMADFSDFVQQLVTVYSPCPTLLNKVCFLNTPCEFLNTSRCVVVTHVFTVLFHGLRKHSKACKETQKVCNDYTPLCLLKHTFKICLNTPQINEM